MELRDLEYFAVLAEHGNIRRASQALGLSAPALSKSLRRLEGSMRCRLFERSSKGITPTPAGVLLLSRVARLRLALRDVAQEASDLSSGRAGHLRVAANPVDCECLPAAFLPLLDAAPRLAIQVFVMDIDVSLPMLDKGDLDLAIVVMPEQCPAGFVSEPLYDDEYAVCCSVDHPLARRRRLRVEDLVEERWALSDASVRPSQVLRRVFQARGLPPPQVALETRSTQVKHETLSRSNLVGFGSRRMTRAAAARFGLKALNINGLTFPRPVCALYRNDGYLSPFARKLLDALKRA
jgi:DNA-binding transcriptional LysR family regulator